MFYHLPHISDNEYFRAFCEMISFPNAKINLGLNILNRRPDGFHEIQSVLYPVGIEDILEVTPIHGHSSNEITSSSGAVVRDIREYALKHDNDLFFMQDAPFLKLSPELNICISAFELIKKLRSNDLTKTFIGLKKLIPAGAGLGGGSSDAASVLKMVNEVFGLKIQNSELKKIASELGSDCPFFIDNTPAMVTGRGDVIHPVALDLSGYFLIVIKPDVSISTPWAYSNVKPSGKPLPVDDLLNLSPDNWEGRIINDFEKVVFSHYPQVELIKKSLKVNGALYASMSGSGSAVYGIFREKVNLKPEFSECSYYSAWL